MTCIECRGAAITEVEVGGRMGGELRRFDAWRWDHTVWRDTEGSKELFAPPRIGGGRYVDPVSRACVAAARALAPGIPRVEPDRLGCVLGTRTGNAYSVTLYERARLEGQRTSPLLFAHAGWNVPAALAAGELGCRGFTSTLCCGERSGPAALQYARSALMRGHASGLAVGVTRFEAMPATAQREWTARASCLMLELVLGPDGGSQQRRFGSEFAAGLPGSQRGSADVRGLAEAYLCLVEGRA